MFEYRGKTAVITGASSGIGRSFAGELAARGMSVILTARSIESLESLAQEIAGLHQVRTDVIPADLSQRQGAAQLADEIVQRGRSVDLLVNNAGFLTHGHFESISPTRERDEVMVNVSAMVELTHAFLPPMLDRQEGGVINVASIAGFQPIPYMAVYAASKAFVISFSVALWQECRDRNVRVVAICPGTTDTPFFDVANAPEAALGKKRSPEQVVATALRGLEQRRSLVVDGAVNGLLSHGPRFIPRWLAAKFAGRAVQPDLRKNGDKIKV
ncbi:MAG: SDR family oxidoreductase [Pirellulales bacterium]|nr:SDR family oxidoreductase [Pirellulales bacterium]